MLVCWFGIWDWVCQRLLFNCVLEIPPLACLAWCGVVCLVCGLLVFCLYVCLFVCSHGFRECWFVGLGFGIGCVNGCCLIAFWKFPLWHVWLGVALCVWFVVCLCFAYMFVCLFVAMGLENVGLLVWDLGLGVSTVAV